MIICELKGCERKYYAKGFCELHYKRNRNGTDLLAPIKIDESHGLTGSREYNTWVTMLQRCNNPKNTNYFKYGARGITVCKRWSSFSNFLKDMGARPDGMTLDRKDNSKGYSKDNCRWATLSVQSLNQRSRKNKSGYTGVSLHGLKWRAKFRRKIIGSFETREQASKAYQSMKDNYLNKLQEASK